MKVVLRNLALQVHKPLSVRWGSLEMGTSPAMLVSSLRRPTRYGRRKNRTNPIHTDSAATARLLGTQASESNTASASQGRTRNHSRTTTADLRENARYEASGPVCSPIKKPFQALGRFTRYSKASNAREASSSSAASKVSRVESGVEEVVEPEDPQPPSSQMTLTPPQTPAPSTSAASTFYVFLEQLRRPLGRHIETFHGLGIREVEDLMALSEMQSEWNEVEKALTENGLSKMEWWVLKDALQNVQGL